MRSLALVALLLCPVAVAAGTRELRGESCGICSLSPCLGGNGYYDACANPCDADVMVRLGPNDAERDRLLPYVGRGKKRTRLRCHQLGAPCAACESDVD